MYIQNGRSVYSDSKVEVLINVNPLHDGIDFNYHRILNCIKIKTSSSNSHFIQFVTRQYPDVYEFNESKGKITRWELVQSFYMEDPINPKWKLDVTEDSKTCFYEEGGLSKKEQDSVSMYDDPTGSYQPDQDRAVFCTFVMINDQITHLIQWSREKLKRDDTEDLTDNYSVKVTLWEGRQLPLWAASILLKHYQSKQEDLPPYLVSRDLQERLGITSAMQLKEESKSFFLLPPDNWITILDFPVLFSKESEKLSEIPSAIGEELAETEKKLAALSHISLGTSTSPTFTPAASLFDTSSSSGDTSYVSAVQPEGAEFPSLPAIQTGIESKREDNSLK